MSAGLRWRPCLRIATTSTTPHCKSITATISSRGPGLMRRLRPQNMQRHIGHFDVDSRPPLSKAGGAAGV